MPRPAGAEGWLPIAGLMNTKYLFLTGRVPAIHPAAMVLFITFMLMSLLLKKAFCSWLCPIGTLSEHLWKLGRRVFGRNLLFHAYEPAAQESLLFLAVPGWNTFRASLEARQNGFSAAICVCRSGWIFRYED